MSAPKRKNDDDGGPPAKRAAERLPFVYKSWAYEDVTAAEKAIICDGLLLAGLFLYEETSLNAMRHVYALRRDADVSEVPSRELTPDEVSVCRAFFSQIRVCFTLLNGKGAPLAASAWGWCRPRVAPRTAYINRWILDRAMEAHARGDDIVNYCFAIGFTIAHEAIHLFRRDCQEHNEQYRDAAILKTPDRPLFKASGRVDSAGSWELAMFGCVPYHKDEEPLENFTIMALAGSCERVRKPSEAFLFQPGQVNRFFEPGFWRKVAEDKNVGLFHIALSGEDVVAVRPGRGHQEDDDELANVRAEPVSPMSARLMGACCHE